MDIFDFNIHLPYLQHKDVNKVIEQDMSLTSEGLLEGFNHHSSHIQKAKGANFLLFNTNLLEEDISNFQQEVSHFFGFATYTFLIDFRRRDIATYLEKIKTVGGNAIMVNSYLQRIAPTEFDDVIRMCKLAEGLGLVVCVDGSYGTSKMYTYDNLQLACRVSDFIHKTPIVIVHAGGLRVMEALLLALEKQNVWLDTSFSLPYYMGATIEQDFAFMMEKLNYERIVFGTDHPYLNFSEAYLAHQQFFQKHAISIEHQEKVFYKNALALFQQ